MNELLLILSLPLIYGAVVAAYKFFGRIGLYAWTVFATIVANIEVLLLVEAFGIEQTLGNILFASTFLVTDILSECFGKKEAQVSVDLGIVTSIGFIVLSQLWLRYQPAANDWAMPSFQIIFSNTPRVMLASLLVYAIVQRFDVWLYHKWWDFSKAKFGDSRRFLWLRNNGSTLLSQLLNTVLYSFGAFGGLYDMNTLMSICLSSYAIFFITSLADTPFIYWARRIKPREV
ncbi:MAG: queuosine precursor transporter [Oscillospiraceae bacterium]|nr:queuosine precursor transporter [Oscillospiraceae bacterium]